MNELEFANWSVVDGITSIVIPVYNQEDYTGQCLTALRNGTRNSYELIVIDNGSGEATGRLLTEQKRKFQRLRVIRNEENLGFTMAANQGLRAAEGQYLVLLNNDVVVTEGWLGGLLRMADSDDRIGIVGPRIVNYQTGRLQGIGGIVFTKEGAQAPVGEDQEPDRQEFTWPRDCQYVEGSCMLIKRAVIASIGYLDTAYAPAYYEDSDYCFRAREAGFRVVYSPYSTVWHYATVTASAVEAEGVPLRRYASRSHRQFVRRWADHFW